MAAVPLPAAILDDPISVSRGVTSWGVSFLKCTQGPLLLTWFNFNSAWINDYMPSKVYDEITYPFRNFNGCTVEF